MLKEIINRKKFVWTVNTKCGTMLCTMTMSFNLQMCVTVSFLATVIDTSYCSRYRQLYCMDTNQNLLLFDFFFSDKIIIRFFHILTSSNYKLASSVICQLSHAFVLVLKTSEYIYTHEWMSWQVWQSEWVSSNLERTFKMQKN